MNNWGACYLIKLNFQIIEILNVFELDRWNIWNDIFPST